MADSAVNDVLVIAAHLKRSSLRITFQCAGLLIFSFIMLRPRLLTILCYGAMMSLAIGINLQPIFLTSIQHSFPGPDGRGLTQEQLGRLGAIAFSGLVVGILITGPLAARFGAKAFALLGNSLLAIGLGVTGWSPTYGVLLAATFCLGLGAGILDMVLSPVVAAINPERRAAAMNWLHSFYCVGAVVTVVAGTLALQAEAWAGESRACFSFRCPWPLSVPSAR